MQAPGTDAPPSQVRTAEPARSVRSLGVAALVGVITGSAIVGFGILAERLVSWAAVGARGATGLVTTVPTWLWSLSMALTHTGDPTLLLVITTITVVLVLVGAGILGRRRPWIPPAIIVVLGAVAVCAIWSTGSSRTALTIPLVATLAGVVTFGALSRFSRLVTPPVPTAGRRRAGADHVVIARRRALVTGALVAVSAGIAGSVGRPSTTGRPAVPSPRPITGAPLLSNEPIMSVHDFGARGDGRTDDGDAIRKGLATVNANGGTLFFPAGTYHYRATAPLIPRAGVTIAGVPGGSFIDFDFPDAGDFVQFCAVSANGVTIDGLTVQRAADFPAVLVELGEFQGFTLSRTTLAGNQDRFPNTDCHGIKIGDGKTTTGIRITDSIITKTTYGLLQTNASTATIRDVQVKQCTFTANVNTDLEFNSPNGSTSQVRIEECIFSNNDSPGFGVGLAHVTGAVVQRNTFDSYALEAVHIEDYSENIVVQDNDFTACGLRDHSHVQVIGKSRGVKISGNTFDATMNTNKIYIVNVLPGGNQTTPGGREPGAPFDVMVQHNRFVCATPAIPVFFQDVRDGSITDNTIAIMDVQDPAEAFYLINSPGTIITSNNVNGQRR